MSDKPTSLREQIEAAYEAQESAADESNTTRDDGGVAQEELVNDVTESPEEKQSDSNQAIESSANDAGLVPVNWSQEDKDAFLELDEKSRKLYLKRYKEMEGGFTKKSQSLAEERRVAENFKKAIAQHEEHLRSIGVDPFSAVDKLLTTERLLRTGTPGQKAEALQKIIADYQIQMHQEAVAQSNQDPMDSQLKALWEEQAKTRQYLAYLENEKKNQDDQKILNQITTFSSSKDENGNLKYPHFEDVREKMGALINAGLAKSLEDSYEQAILLNDDLRKEYIMRHTNESKRLEDVKKRTASSKQAGFNVKSNSSSVMTEPEQKLSRRELIEREYEAQQKRNRI